jgi:hypothetical protein
MRRFLSALAVVFAAFGVVSAAEAAVQVHIDIVKQRMLVRENGATVGVWPVSTARRGKITPTGTYRPYSMRARHFSSLYNNAPMPHSIFFRGNYAIHGTTEVSRLGNPASAGCIRLHPANAARLFAIVQRNGMTRTRITITRGLPAGSEIAREMDAAGSTFAMAVEEGRSTAVASRDRRERAATARADRERPVMRAAGGERRAVATGAARAQTQRLASAEPSGVSPNGVNAGASPHWDNSPPSAPPHTRLRGALN